MRSSRLTEKFRVSAPWDVKLEPLCGRKVFVEPAVPAVEEDRLDAPLRLIGHWQPGSPEWIKADRTADHAVSISFVISADGQVVNPEVEVLEDADEAFVAVYTLAQTRWDPPLHAGEPANVRVRRTLTMKAGTRQWLLPDLVMKSIAVEPPAGPRDVGAEMDRRPVLMKRVEPDFPRGLREKGARGMVEVEFVVTSSGEVVDAKIHRSTHPDFNAPALAAIQQWKYEPGMKSGRAVNTRMRQSIVFDVHWP